LRSRAADEAGANANARSTRSGIIAATGRGFLDGGIIVPGPMSTPTGTYLMNKKKKKKMMMMMMVVMMMMMVMMMYKNKNK
jgi:uncharacterized membrane protein YfcA